jgi:2-phospho-L-lactate guanylyltransferase (CobY/MobA/RfbA family)
VSTDVFVLPLKRFDVAKERLRVGGTSDVTRLAEELAIEVIQRCAPRRVIVLSESDEISAFATRHHVEVLESSATSLNEAVQGAYSALARRYECLIIIHGDLRAPAGLGAFEPGPGVTIITDHHGRGTNVLALPTGLDFHFAYGDGSAQLHEREALRLGVDVRIITDSPWRFDVDEPSDLN